MKRMVLLPILIAGIGVSLMLVALSKPLLADPGEVLVNRTTGVDQPGCGDGVLDPCFSIQYAVANVASSGDRVLVATGTYTETFSMQPGVDVVSVSGPEVTVIDGEFARGPMVAASGSSITPAVTLEGFMITRGYTDWLGGAVFVGNGASLVISDSHIYSNTADVGGGAISLNSDASLLIYGSTIEDNTKTAMRVDDAAATILHSSFLSNTRGTYEGWGGGIGIENGSALVISDTLFQGNSAHHGGGLWFVDSDLKLFNSDFYSNTAGGGGGVMSLGSVTFEIRGNSFDNNEARSAGGIGIGGDASNHASGVFAENTVSSNVNTTHGGAGLRIEYGTVVITGNQFISNTGLSHGGGGIRIDGTSNFEIRDNTVAFNEAPAGAGILINGGVGDIISNVVTFNESMDGGDGGAGIRIGNATVVISDNHIMGNTSHTHGGGGVWIDVTSDFVIYDNFIANNVADAGAGIHIKGGVGDIISNTILSNQVTGDGGGGIYVGTAVITITSNQIYSNTSLHKNGGGIRLAGNSEFAVSNNIIEYNSATSGGGISVYGGSGIVEDNEMRYNQADGGGEGGGIGVWSPSHVIVRNNWISDNRRGGLTVSNANAAFENNIIANNESAGARAQVSIHGDTAVTLTNNTIVGNGIDNGIDIKSNGSPTLINNIVAGNAYGIRGWGAVDPTLIHNNLWDNSSGDFEDVVPGANDIICDPDFEDADFNDFHLGICSCAVDQGTNDGAPAVDYDGNARPVDGDGVGEAVVDIGAYERLTVTQPLPIAGFSYEVVGLVVTFTNTSSGAASYEWDFGDGVGASTEVNPAYSYSAFGNYTTVLTATCSFGCKDVYQELIEFRQYSIDKTVTGADAVGDGIINNAGEIIDYQIVVGNAGNVDLTGVSVSDPLLEGAYGTISDPVESMNPDGVLEAGEIWTYSGSYTVQQSDFNDNGGGDGDIDNTATVSSDLLPDGNNSAEQPIVRDPQYSIDKTITGVDTAGDGTINNIGEVIDYQIVVSNTGNVDLTGVSVSDPLLEGAYGTFYGPTESISSNGVLEAGEIWTYSGSYTVQQSDFDDKGGGDGDIDNTATVSSNDLPDESDSAEQPIERYYIYLPILMFPQP